MGDRQWHHYQIGVTRLRLASVVEEIITHFDYLYRQFRVTDSGPDALWLEVAALRPKPWSRTQYIVRSSGREFFAGHETGSIIPELEFALNQQTILRNPQYLIYHSAAMEFEGQGVLLPADSGTGKTTLTTYLLARGWRYLSDELGVVDPQTWMLHPYPKAPCIKAEGLALIEQLGLTVYPHDGFRLRDKRQRFYISPTQLGRQAIAPAVPLRHIIFLGRGQVPGPYVEQFSTAESTMYLYRTSVNPMAHREQGLARAIDLVQHCNVWAMALGDHAATCPFLEALLAEHDHHPVAPQANPTIKVYQPAEPLCETS
ncbi:MAG: hypothetical protein HJJLKODD_02898 [Phycisphaerae bacterium]|nr:hypothetical protein [Phycisphaerae bacterium]